MPATVYQWRWMRRRSKPKRPRQWRSLLIRGNCLSWALRQQRRRGGYIVVRPADLDVPIFHFGWTPREGGPIYHFRPLNPNVRLPWPYLWGYIAMHEDEQGP